MKKKAGAKAPAAKKKAAAKKGIVTLYTVICTYEDNEVLGTGLTHAQATALRQSHVQQNPGHGTNMIPE